MSGFPARTASLPTRRQAERWAKTEALRPNNRESARPGTREYLDFKVALEKLFGRPAALVEVARCPTRG
jgi:hypothetical protein